MGKEIFDSNVGISEWYPVLNWECLPDMGPCHSYAASGEIDQFKQRYLVEGDLERFYGTVLDKLRHNRATQAVVLIKGDPGIGKTTFIYSLVAHTTSNKILNEKYVIYACHANNIQGNNWEHEVLYHAKKALKVLFMECNQMERFDTICCKHDDGDEGLRQQVRCLKTCVSDSEHRAKFTKTLIFVLDNVDSVTESERVLDAFELVNNVLEPGIIKKWFVVRQETLTAKYTKTQRERLFSFVADQLAFPKVNLFDVAKKRINNTTGAGENKINPFSKEMCDEVVLPFCNGNLRDGLSVLEAILRNVSPKGFAGRNTDESVIQNYIRKGMAKTLAERELLVNLHLAKYRVIEIESPIIYDLLCFVPYTNEKRKLLALLYEATEMRNKYSAYCITGRERKLIIQDHEITKAFEILDKENLVIWNKNEGYIQLTKLGNAHIKVASQKYYVDICRDLASHTRSETYWKVASINISHASIARKFGTSKII